MRKISPKTSPEKGDLTKMSSGRDFDDAQSYEDDFENEDDEEGSGEEEEEGEEEDEEEDSSEEESDDSEKEDGDEEDSDENSEEESSDDEDSRKINIKVYVLPVQDTRGYSLALTKSGLAKVRKKLSQDYALDLKLFVRDDEGDKITIKSIHDLKYAYKALKASNSKQESKTGPFVLKIYADLATPPAALAPIADQQAALLPSSSTTGIAHTPDGFEVLWKKGDLLGTGSFGKVFAGINLTSGERMAVKEVHFTDDKRSRQQAKALQREVQILSSLQHVNVVRYIGTEMSGHTLRIFLEFATNGTLKDALQEFGPFPEPLLRVYTADILDGLVYLHECKMIHRDVKPANLLLSNGVVKLADFGCSSGSLFKDAR